MKNGYSRIRLKGMDWSDMALDRCKRQTLVSELSGSIKCGKFLD